jgi:hypothetical protein
MSVLVRYFDRRRADGSTDRTHVVQLRTPSVAAALALTCELIDGGVEECMIDAPDRCWRVQSSAEP